MLIVCVVRASTLSTMPNGEPKKSAKELQFIHIQILAFDLFKDDNVRVFN